MREIFSVGPLQPTARITSVFLSANADILTCYSLIVREGEEGGGGPGQSSAQFDSNIKSFQHQNIPVDRLEVQRTECRDQLDIWDNISLQIRVFFC